MTLGVEFSLLFSLTCLLWSQAVVLSILQAQEAEHHISSLVPVRLLSWEQTRVFLATNAALFFFQRKVVLVGSTEG